MTTAMGPSAESGADRIPVPRRRAVGAVRSAAVGDRLVIHSQHVDGPTRDAEILEVRHEDGGPPYVVRWSDTGHESLIFPGPDATIEHFEHSHRDTEVARP